MGRPRTIQDRPCEMCGELYFPSRRSRRFCSLNCAVKHPSHTRGPGGFVKGQTPWNKGLAGFRKGHIVTTETREKIRAAVSGPNAGNWKGGITSIHYRIRRSKKYAAWRSAVFKRDNFTCVLCGVRARKGRRVELHADHIKPFAFFPDLRFDIGNGRTLCKPCHLKTPTFGFTGKRAVNLTRKEIVIP